MTLFVHAFKDHRNPAEDCVYCISYEWLFVGRFLLPFRNPLTFNFQFVSIINYIKSAQNRRNQVHFVVVQIQPQLHPNSWVLWLSTLIALAKTFRNFNVKCQLNRINFVQFSALPCIVSISNSRLCGFFIWLFYLPLSFLSIDTNSHKFTHTLTVTLIVFELVQWIFCCGLYELPKINDFDSRNKPNEPS